MVPWRAASFGERNRIGKPSSQISPSSGDSKPARIRINVDFPDPSGVIRSMIRQKNSERSLDLA